MGWSRNGTVVFRFKGSMPRSYLLSAFSSGFWDVLRPAWKDESELADYLKKVFEERYRQTGRTSTYETGQPLPRTIIKDRKRSYGELIKLGDGSHPTSLEIEETEPFYASDLRKTVEKLAGTIDKIDGTMGKVDGVLDKFGENVQSHLELINKWKRENDYQTRKESLCFDDASVREVIPIAYPERGWCPRCCSRQVLPYSAESFDGSDRVCLKCARALFQGPEAKKT